MAFQAGIENCGINFNGSNDADWSLLLPEYIGGYGQTRSWSRDVTFSTEFGDGETVVVALAPVALDIVDGASSKYMIWPSSVAVTGFTLNVSVWAQCQMRGISVQWLAYDSGSAI
jgi:hypothetical protein